MNFQLSPELKSTIDELVIDWIRLHYDELVQELEETKYEYEKESYVLLNEYLKSELFYQLNKWNFGKYLKESQRINANDIIQLIQYCLTYYYTECNEVRGILNFTKIHDLEYLGVQFGYIYADIEINVLEEFNLIKNVI